MVTLCFCILAGRLVWIQVVKAEEIAGRAVAVRLQEREEVPLRGAILDRSGRPLAVSVPISQVFVNRLQLREEQEPQVAAELASILDLSAEEVLRRMRQSPSPGRALVYDEADSELVDRLMADLPHGVYVERTDRRSYPQGDAANQVIGWLNSEGRGASGLEAFYDEVLRGEPERFLAEFTLGGVPIEHTIREHEEGKPALDLLLTLDLGLQQLAEQTLDRVIKEWDAKRALVIAMDAHTGEILVMAMRPGADLNDRASWGDPVEWDRLTNWAIRDSLSPGSIFKTITTAAALEERAITLDTTFIDTGKMELDGWVIRNWDQHIPADPEPMTIAELLQRSSNIGLIQVGQRLGPERFIRYLQSFGFMERTGIDLPGEGTSVGLSNFDEKKAVDWANMYIGQHLEVTPIQMIRAVAAIANGGRLVTPHLVKEMRDPEGRVVWAAQPPKGRQAISQATAREVRQLMVSVIEEGTARAAKMEGYTAGGKTGTAQQYPNGVERERKLADFVGFAPASNPQVVMLVMVDEPKGHGYGGVIAAPIFGELMPHVLRAINIPPDSPAALGEEQAPPRAVEGVVPDVRWLPVARAQERLASAGFTFELEGQGAVVSAQSVAPGTEAERSSTVVLTVIPAPEDGKVHVPDFSGLSLVEAVRLAEEVGLTLKAGGSGFVAAQDPPPGQLVPARSTLSVRLAPRP